MSLFCFVRWILHVMKIHLRIRHILYRQQPSPLLYSIDIWPARNSRLKQRETNHYITRWASELAWPYLAGSSPGQLVIDLLAQHQRFAVCCQLFTISDRNCREAVSVIISFYIRWILALLEQFLIPHYHFECAKILSKRC